MYSISKDKYQVTVEEYYTIDNPEKGFNDTISRFTVELIDGEFYITDLELWVNKLILKTALTLVTIPYHKW